MFRHSRHLPGIEHSRPSSPSHRDWKCRVHHRLLPINRSVWLLLGQVVHSQCLQSNLSRGPQLQSAVFVWTFVLARNQILQKDLRVHCVTCVTSPAYAEIRCPRLFIVCPVNFPQTIKEPWIHNGSRNAKITAILLKYRASLRLYKDVCL